MSVNIIQTTVGGFDGPQIGGPQAPFANALQGGSNLACFISFRPNPAIVGPFTDSQNNTWNQVNTPYPAYGNTSFGLAYAPSSISGNDTVYVGITNPAGFLYDTHYECIEMSGVVSYDTTISSGNSVPAFPSGTITNPSGNTYTFVASNEYANWTCTLSLFTGNDGNGIIYAYVYTPTGFFDNIVPGWATVTANPWDALYTVASIVAPSANINLSPNNLDVGNIVLGYTSNTETIVVTNTGTANVMLANIVISGSPQFTVSNNANFSANLLPGESFDLFVQFSPTALGPSSATANIGVVGVPNPFTATITGVGVGIYPGPEVPASQYGYVKAIGDPDYNFGLNDFTIEFWVRQSSNQSNIQTVFELTNNEPQYFNTLSQIRFFAVLDNGNLNVVCANTIYAGTYNPSTPYVIGTNSTANLTVFYDGVLLPTTGYSLSANVLTVNNPISGNVLIEPASVVFSISGPQLTSNVDYFVSVERMDGEVYLYVNGIEEGRASGNCYIPANMLGNSIPVNNAPALITIGANRDGWNPFSGYFGDFRVTNGIARHVVESQPQGNIYSTLTDSTLGTAAQNINITGGQLGSATGFGPEELFPGHAFDTLNFQIYQDSTANSSIPVLGWRIFKSTVTEGPTPAFSTTGDGITSNFKTPWSVPVNADSIVVLIDGVAQPSNAFTLGMNYILFGATPAANANITAQLTGNTWYYSLGATGITELVAPLYNSDDTIYLADSSGFLTPVLQPGKLGVVFINGERIVYRYKTGNALSGLSRGTIGTGVPNTHPYGSRVVSACTDRLLPGIPGNQTWYTLGNGTPSDGQGLANSNTAFASFLLSQGTILPG